MVGQVRLPQCLLQQQQVGWTFSLCWSPPELWAWLKSGLFSDSSLPFVCKTEKNVKKKKKNQQKKKDEGSALALGCLFSSLMVRKNFFLRTQNQGATRSFWPCGGWWTNLPPMSCPPHDLSDVVCPQHSILKEQETFHTRTTTATHPSSRVNSEPPTFPPWLDFFPRLLSCLESAFKFLIKTRIFCKWYVF